MALACSDEQFTIETGEDAAGVRKRRGPVQVTICIATYRRPLGLERLLYSLNELTFAKATAPEIEVVVVDNDPKGSAADLCAGLSPRLRWTLHYEPEPRRGVSQARNRALLYALERATHVAFIDDDETVTPQWLDELLNARADYEADAVAGPVLARFEEPVPAWITKGGFFQVPRHRTGAHIRDCGTGNVLLTADAVKKMDRLFDERLGLIGGEDTEFFVRFTQAGLSLVWADQAIAYEWVPASRARARWILLREYRTATTWSRCEKMIRPAAGDRATRAAKGLARIVHGLLLLPLSFRGRHALVHALLKLARGTGHLMGLAGIHYHEYRVVHGK